MADIRHYFEEEQIQEPRNWKAVKVSANWQDKKEVGIDITTLNFAGGHASKIIERANKSIFEGSYYKIEFGNINNPAFVFNGNLDYSDDFTQIGCNECLVKLKKEQGSDWLEERADSFSLAYLYDIGLITDSDFVRVPYVINYIPDNMQLLILSLSIFMLTKEIIETAKVIQTTTKDIIEGVTPNAGVPPSWNLGKIIGNGLNVLINVVYAVTMAIAIAKMIQEITAQILPKKRYHLGMKLSTMMERSCTYLGLTYESEQIAKYGDLVLIPTKGFKGGEPNEYDVEAGFPNVNDNVYTFGDLIRVWSDILNSDYRITNGVFKFERRDYWRNTSSYTMPSVYNDQDKLEFVKKYNTNEMVANYNINFGYDTQDVNTLDNQDRRVYQNTIALNNVNNKKLNNLKGLKEVRVPYAFGIRKESLTGVEKALKNLLKISDSITGRNDSNKIESRLGTMHMSSDYISTPKVVVMDGDVLKANQRNHFNAELLWNNEHYINSFVEINGVHNQYEIYEGVKVPFCEDDFKTLIDNNYFVDKDGNVGLVDSLEWLPFENSATINYRINKKYFKN